MWHEHFSKAKLGALLRSSGLEVIAFDGGGLFTRVIALPLQLMFGIKPIRRRLQKLQSLDQRRFSSANLFCLARKAETASDTASDGVEAVRGK